MAKRASKRKMTIPGRYASVAQACSECAEVARSAGLDEDTVFHVQMAVDEACTNIIEHAYGGEDVGSIELSCCVQDDDLVVTLHDHGQPFDPDKVQPPKFNGDLEKASTGGLGLYFMRRLMDRVHFEFDPKKGNTLVMVKHTDRHRSQGKVDAGDT